ncbi:MAG: SLBB domain-containing protein [Bacteroidetes bacterium]|nr:SLBB domain-containing protein [Bacteroidota bacterium]
MKPSAFLFGLLMVIQLSLSGQDIFGPAGLRNLNPASLSNVQIQAIRTQVKASGLSDNDLRTYLMGKGMSQNSASELIRRLQETSTGQAAQQPQESSSVQNIPPATESQKLPASTHDSLFGASLFTNSQLNFAPPQFFATPVNYILGPGDLVNLSITGNQEIFTDIRVEPSGNLRLPYAGNLMVGGLTIEQAAQKVQAALARHGFESLRDGGSRLTLSMSAYRSIPVTIIGAKQPGNYYVSSIATAFHLIHLAGGPGPAGSYRDIEVIRKGEVVAKIDLYDFLVRGDMRNNVRLEENDLINIPAYQIMVRLEGAVKRPGWFMLKQGETLADLMNFAGGFGPEAFQGHIAVEQIGSNALFSKTIALEDFNRYLPANGDRFYVGTVTDERYHRVFITGAIKRPGAYGWQQGLKLSELISLAGGPAESLLETRGLIYRSGKNHTNAYLRFVPAEILQSSADILLMDGDSIVLSDRKAFFPYGFVDVVGEVNGPGRFILAPGMTALDAALLAGGMKISAITHKIEIVRRNENFGKSTVALEVKADSDASLRIRADEVELKHQDVVIVKPDPDLRNQHIVYLRGEVSSPGPYVLLERNEKISSLLQRAGGLTNFADENAVFILRKNTNPLLQRDYTSISNDADALFELDSLAAQRAVAEAFNRNNTLNRLNQSPSSNFGQTSTFSTGFSMEYGLRSEPDEELIHIALSNVNNIIRRPGSRNDLQLQDGDEIVVLEKDNSVSVRGMVNNQITVNYSGKNVRTYISEAGGVLHNGARNSLFVLQPNGKAAMTKSFLGIKNYPDVQPGSIIVVPAKPETKRRIDPAASAAIASIITSVSSLLFIIISASK